MAQPREFTVAEREQIRTALRRYMQHHDIEETILQQRMEQHLDRTDIPYVKKRSLQRFLAGTHRTDDDKVHRYNKFLQKVAPPPVESKVGAGLAEFFYPAGGPARSVADYAGRYVATIRPYIGNFKKPVADDVRATLQYLMKPLRPGARGSKLFIDLLETEDTRFLRVSEARGIAADSNGPLGILLILTSGLFIRSSEKEFAIISRGLTNLRMGILRTNGRQPVSFKGTVLHTQLTPVDRVPAYEIDMTRVEESTVRDIQP